MNVKGFWRVNAGTLAVLILVNLMLTATSDAVWIAVGVLALLAGMVLNFNQGMRIGQAACGVSSTVASVKNAGEQVYRQLDDRYLRQAWSPTTGLRGLFASALPPYAVGCAYIVLFLLQGQALAPTTPLTVARVAAWVLSLPFWPLILYWHEDFVALTPAIAAMLMLSPFVLPACTFAGYMQGPKLWARTEAAMMAGRRRAKARARVGRKLAPKPKKPEI